MSPKKGACTPCSAHQPLSIIRITAIDCHHISHITMAHSKFAERGKKKPMISHAAVAPLLMIGEEKRPYDISWN